MFPKQLAHRLLRHQLVTIQHTTLDRMRSAQHLHGFVLALLVISLSPWLVRAAPIVEFSGDDSSGSFKDNQLSTNWESLAEWLHSEVLKLRDQQFRDVFNLTIDNSYLSLYTIKLPQITVADGCLSSAFKTIRRVLETGDYLRHGNYLKFYGIISTLQAEGIIPLHPIEQFNSICSILNTFHFTQENCLRTIAMGLQEYLQYMDYVKDSYTSGKDEIEKVCETIQNLSADVFQRVKKNPQSVIKLEMNTKDILSHSSDSEWGRAVNVHVILREFTNFMEKTYIAIRHINE